MKRSSGILLPLFSLPSPYGIGTIASAKSFLNYLSACNQKYWQILPLGPTGYSNSPYQTYSAFACDPIYIDPGELLKAGLISPDEEAAAHLPETTKVDYAAVRASRKQLFRLAFSRCDKSEVAKFLKKEPELNDYCLFMAIKDSLNGAPLSEWPEDIRLRESSALLHYSQNLHEDVLYHGFLQLEFRRQWADMRQIADSLGISIIGDIPMYVSADSADFWSHPSLFMTDEKGDPTDVAGVPPDYFSENGQLWGNPLYDYAVMKKDGYKWWKKRVRHELEFCDILRIDHFRGFSEFWAVPAGEEDASKGRWIKGPGMKLVSAIMSVGGKDCFIAEDLGILSDDARALIEKSGLPGMKILEFAFDTLAPSDYQPHRYPTNCVAYTGTHDNNTSMGWMGEISESVRRYAVKYLALNADEGWHIGMIRALYASNAQLVIIPLQDYIGMDGDGRINTPSTVEGNWLLRIPEELLSDKLAQTASALVKMYER